MHSLGVPEVLVVLVSALVYLAPLAAVVWIIFTLRKIQADNAAIRSKLQEIEQLLLRTPSA